MFQSLLSRGYFPAELPPPFWTVPYGEYVSRTPAFLGTSRKWGKCSMHSIPRGGHARRRISIPNPFWFGKLACLVTERQNWEQIKKQTRQSPYSLTWPRRDNTGHRAFIYRCTYPQVDRYKLWNRSGKRYVISADVQRFYHSIYTHTIPWVFHTKEWAKDNFKTPCLGNDADKFLRSAQDGQTVGIPIGPDTSFLIAESLLAHVDMQLNTELGDVAGTRFMDEWEFAFEKVADAESAIALIEERLSSIELSLNPSKVILSEGPVPLRPSWITALQTIEIPRTLLSERAAVTLFDMAFELSAENKTKGVLNWALSRIMSCSFGWATWRVIEPMVLQAAASEPGSLPRAIRFFVMARKAGHAVHDSRLESTLGSIIVHSSRRAHWSEVAWAIWGHITFGIPLQPVIIRELERTDDPVVALVALDAHSKGLIDGSAVSNALQKWTGLVRPEALDGEDWLLSFEATIKGWINRSHCPIGTDFHFKSLKEAQVSFYRDDLPPDELTLSNKWSAPDWLTPSLGYHTAVQDNPELSRWPPKTVA